MTKIHCHQKAENLILCYVVLINCTKNYRVPQYQYQKSALRFNKVLLYRKIIRS